MGERQQNRAQQPSSEHGRTGIKQSLHENDGDQFDDRHYKTEEMHSSSDQDDKDWAGSAGKRERRGFICKYTSFIVLVSVQVCVFGC